MPWLYRIWVLGALGFFGWGTLSGWRAGSEPHARIDPSVRSSPGGYRSYHFWYTGISGGK